MHFLMSTLRALYTLCIACIILLCSSTPRAQAAELRRENIQNFRIISPNLQQALRHSCHHTTPPMTLQTHFALTLSLLSSLCRLGEGNEADMAKAIGDGVSNFLNDDGNHTLAPTPSPTPSPHGSTTGNETDQDIMEYFLIGIVCIMFLFTISTFGMSMIRGCKHVSSRTNLT